MLGEVEAGADLLEDLLVEKELPHVEKLDHGAPFIIKLSRVECDLEELLDPRLEVAHIVALHVLQNAVEHIHVGQSIATFVLHLLTTSGTYIDDVFYK